METGYECTAYFRGRDGKGTCDDECQWWRDEGCVCAKGSKLWDGKEHYLIELAKEQEEENA